MDNKNTNASENLPGKISDAEIAAELLQYAGWLALCSDVFTGMVVRRPEDLPDTVAEKLLLAILPPEPGFFLHDGGEKRAEEILLGTGANPRRYRNRVIFALSEADKIERARDCARTPFAIRTQEGEGDSLIPDPLLQAVDEAYSVLLVPESPGKTSCFLRPVSLTGHGIWADPVAQSLREEDALLDVWDPVSLQEHLQRYYFKKGSSEVTLARVWDDLCRHCYMERLQNENVLLESARQGVEMGLFGCAAEKKGQGYRDLVIGRAAGLSPDSLLVCKQRVEDCLEDQRRRKQEGVLKTLEQMFPEEPEEPDDE
ncbi:MAG: hypothetical protein IKE64_13790 [Thermoguttaceae bacterium]|nr:hypothetical protein [Thermoguttaceae bacterium]